MHCLKCNSLRVGYDFDARTVKRNLNDSFSGVLVSMALVIVIYIIVENILLLFALIFWRISTGTIELPLM